MMETAVITHHSEIGLFCGESFWKKGWILQMGGWKRDGEGAEGRESPLNHTVRESVRR